MKLAWLGHTYDVAIEGKTNTPLPWGSSALWAPGEYPSGDRPEWIADYLPPGAEPIEATGATPQAALDALAAMLPQVDGLLGNELIRLLAELNAHIAAVPTHDIERRKVLSRTLRRFLEIVESPEAKAIDRALRREPASC